MLSSSKCHILALRTVDFIIFFTVRRHCFSAVDAMRVPWEFENVGMLLIATIQAVFNLTTSQMECL